MSKYQKSLIAHIKSNPMFLQPEHRKNEILGFLKKPLNDLCISRPKSRLNWGIELPFDSDYVTFVLMRLQENGLILLICSNDFCTSSRFISSSEF